MIRVVEFHRRLNNGKNVAKNQYYIFEKKKFLHSADHVHFEN